MREQELQIHLRRRYVEQAQARRPRLPQRLRALGAVGPVVRPLAADSQSAFVKTTITNGTTTGKHLAYLTHGKGRTTGPTAPSCFRLPRSRGRIAWVRAICRMRR